MSRGFPKGLPLVLGVGSVILLLASSEAKPAPKVTPKPPEPPPEPPPPEPPPPPILPDEPPPPTFGEFVALGEAPSVERERRILQAVRSGMSLPIEWIPVESDYGPHIGTLYVSNDALRLPIAATLRDGSPWTGVSRVNVTHPSASLIGTWIGAYTPTSKISDLAWEAAPVKGTPQTQTPDASMMNTSRMVEHSRAIDARQTSSGGLVRPVGKDYVASPKNDAEHGTIFGWHWTEGGYTSPGGVRVLQPVSNAHPWDYRDYSHFPTFVRRTMLVDGELRDVADIARDPELHPMVSDEGPIESMIHPRVRR